MKDIVHSPLFKRVRQFNAIQIVAKILRDTVRTNKLGYKFARSPFGEAYVLCRNVDEVSLNEGTYTVSLICLDGLLDASC